MSSTRLANSGYAARGRGVAPAVAGELEELPAFSLEQLGGAPMVPPGLPRAEERFYRGADGGQQADGERR
jgi:hypothetical protein